MIENEALRTENSDHLQSRERLKHDQQYIARENDRLRLKIEELQRFVHVGLLIVLYLIHMTLYLLQ